MNNPPHPVLLEPFHEGEKALQQLSGAFGALSVAGPRVIRSFMPDPHREFFSSLPWLLLGGVDDAGQPWASALAGAPGFMHSPDPLTLRIDAVPQAHDPLAGALAVGAPVGLLGLQPHTRRRNRMNGVVSTSGAPGFTVQVRQSFGNCPQYIQAREPVWAGPHDPGAVHQDTRLDATALRIVEAADTFFIATAHPTAGRGAAAHGVDVSHRGGRPGFVKVVNNGALTVPDYNGNHFFNTLGNIALNPRCGLLFIDYPSGDLLYLAVTAQLQWEGAALAAHPGAQRLLHLQVNQVRRVQAALPLHWGAAQLSPVLP